MQFFKAFYVDWNFAVKIFSLLTKKFWLIVQMIQNVTIYKYTNIDYLMYCQVAKKEKTIQ